MRRITLLSLVSLLILVVWSGCNVESVAPDNTPKTVTTTVAGQVVDESGKPVQGAQIAAYGKTAVTTQYGTFLIKGVAAPQERCLVKVSKSGYFDGFRAEQPLAGGITQMRIGLMSNAPQGSFPTSAGRTVTAPNSMASVAFPPNGYVTESGTPYAGEVSYVVRHLNPTAPNFFDFFSGDFQGVRTDGSMTEMLSYGVLQVELTGANGEKLNLATGKKATVNYPLPSKMTTDAPAEMPLWWFDGTKGMWKEEGKAVRQGNFYTGTVSHFTPWNCDYPVQTTMLRVHVTFGNEGVAGVLVHIGERTGITDSNGYASYRLPAGLAFIVKVYTEANDGLESAEIVTGPYSAGATNQLELPLITCLAYVKGDLYGCSDSSIDGTIIAEYDGGGFTFGFAQNGRFRFRVKLGAVITIKAMTSEGKESEPIVVAPLECRQSYDTGILTACKMGTIEANDYDLNVEMISNPDEIFYGKVMISANGARTFVFYNGMVTVINTITGDIVQTITYSTADTAMNTNIYDVSADGSFMLIGVSGKYALYDVSTATILQQFFKYPQMVLSADGKTLAAWNLFASTIQLHILNAQTGMPIRSTLEINKKPMGFLVSQLSRFLSDTTFGVIEDRPDVANIKILSSNNFTLLQTITIGSVRDKIIAQSADGSVIGITYPAGSVIFHKTLTGEKLQAFYVGGKFAFEHSIGIAPSNDQFVVQTFRNGKYSPPTIFAIGSGQAIKLLPSKKDASYYGLQFSADGKKLVGAYIENNRLKLRVWNFK